MPAPTLTDIPNPRKFGYGLSLNDRLFRLAVGPGRELTIRTAPLEDPTVQTESSPEEFVESSGKTFARSTFDGGEGLFRAHVEGAAANRFWDSKNVSVSPAEPGEFPEIRLLHSTSNIESSASTGLYTAYDPIGGSLYMCEGTVLRRTDNPTATTPTWADDDPHNGETATNVTGVAVLGDEVYAALNANGIHRKSSGTWAHWADNPTSQQYQRVWAVKGRIVASTGQSLYEVTASGAAPSALKTLPPGETWQDVCDGGSHILCAASDGYVYAYETDTGSMVLSSQTLFEGETPRALGQSQGVVAVGTSAGNIGFLWVGEVGTTGQLDGGQGLQLVKQWGESGTATAQYPTRIIGTRNALYAAVPDGTDTFLWRYDLSTAGLSRHLTVSGSSGLVRGIAVIEGRVYTAVDGAGMFREDATYATSGYLIGPLGDFFSASDKSWIGARMETGALTSGMTVELYYTVDPDALNDPDSSSWIRVTRRDSGSGDPGEHALTSVVSRSLAGMVKLTPSSDLTSTPAVRSFSFRAYPSSGDNDVIVELPINVSDQVERRGLRRARVLGRGETELATLQGLEGRPVTLRLFKPELTIRGLVEQVATPVQSLTRRGSTTMVAQVTVKGKKVGAGASTSGIGTFATYHLFGTTPTFGEVA